VFWTKRLKDHAARSVTQTIAQACIVIASMPLGGAVLYGGVTAVRGMTKTESAETLTIYQMVFLTFFFTLGLPVFGFAWPTWSDLSVMLLNGLINAVGQYRLTRSLTLAPPPRGRAVLLLLALLSEDTENIMRRL
jgi:hypothetical protein